MDENKELSRDNEIKSQETGIDHDLDDIPFKRTRISRDKMFGLITNIVAMRSTCLRSQVGALIVGNGRIISMGYNGPVSGKPQCTSPLIDCLEMGLPLEEVFKLRKTACMGPGCTRSLHAETNAIAFAARAGISVDGCTLYCSLSPCINCAKVIINSGIKELVFLDSYRDSSGLELLLESGILVSKLNLDTGERQSLRVKKPGDEVLISGQEETTNELL